MSYSQEILQNSCFLRNDVKLLTNGSDIAATAEYYRLPSYFSLNYTFWIIWDQLFKFSFTLFFIKETSIPNIALSCRNKAFNSNRFNIYMKNIFCFRWKWKTERESVTLPSLFTEPDRFSFATPSPDDIVMKAQSQSRSFLNTARQNKAGSPRLWQIFIRKLG